MEQPLSVDSILLKPCGSLLVMAHLIILVISSPNLFALHFKILPFLSVARKHRQRLKCALFCSAFYLLLRATLSFSFLILYAVIMDNA